MEWLKYHYQTRRDSWNHLVRLGKLFEEFILDAYTVMVGERLEYFRKNQAEMRQEMLQGTLNIIT